MDPITISYDTYIGSQRWQNRRQERLRIDSFECQTCAETQRLEVHHRHYKTFMNEDPEQDLITLCAWCHTAITDSIRSRRYANRSKMEIPDYVDAHVKTTNISHTLKVPDVPELIDFVDNDPRRK